MLDRRRFLGFLMGLPGVGVAMKLLGRKEPEAPILAALRGPPEKVPIYKLLRNSPRIFVQVIEPITAEEGWWRNENFLAVFPREQDLPGVVKYPSVVRGLFLNGCRLGHHLLNVRTSEVVEIGGFSTSNGNYLVGPAEPGMPEVAPELWFVTRGRGSEPPQDILAGDEFLLLGYAGAETDLDSCGCEMCKGFENGSP